MPVNLTATAPDLPRSLPDPPPPCHSYWCRCCAQKNQQGVNDPSCNGQIGADCSSQPPANRDQCCAQKEAQGIDDPACPNTLNPNGITPK